MIHRIIAWSLHHRGFVLLIATLLAVLGVHSLRTTPIDAIPDLSDTQVIIYSEFPGQAPGVVDDQVTTPLAAALLSVPHARDVRGYSFFGYSLVYVLFEDGTDLYWARSRVLEYLNVARGGLPAGVEPQLGPDATGVGWVYQYVLTDFSPRAEVLRSKLDLDGNHTVDDDELPYPDDPDDDHLYRIETLQELLAVSTPPSKAASATTWTNQAVTALYDGFDRDGDGRISRQELRRACNFRGVGLDTLRSLQDWYLRYDLMSVPGVAEVASVGGFVRQYQVEVDPEKLRAYHITFQAVKQAIQNANLDAGGRLIEMAETEFMVRGQGYIRSLEDLETVPVGLNVGQHVPILLSQVARVQLGPSARRGVVEMNGEGEVVSGIIVMRSGENARTVIAGVEDRLETLKRGLPEGVEVSVAYDRSVLIDGAIDHLQRTLFEEMAVVALMCLVVLLHVRSALVSIIAIPLAVLLSFIPMKLLGVGANIMSLGGIALAIGVLDDASVVLVEDLHRTREEHPELSRIEAILRSTEGLGSALFFSLLIVTASFLPVFALQEQEGRLFGPLATTKTFTMMMASGLAVTVIPVLMYYLVRGPVRPLRQNPIARAFQGVYRPVLRWALAFPKTVLVLAIGAILATAWPLQQLGDEFMPPLNEGDLLYMPTTPPGISITAARDLLQKTDRLIAAHPQVERVLGKAGRAETATDPAPLSMLETTILLTPEDQWPRGKSIEDIAAELDDMVQVPGLTNSWTMPIKTRIDMLATGIKTPVGIKLLGDDLEELAGLGAEIEQLLAGVDDTASVFAERVVGGRYVDITIRRQEAARYGLNVRDIQDVVTSAIGGFHVTTTLDGLAQIPVTVRYPRELRDNLEALRQVAVHTPMGHTVPLGQVADLTISTGPPVIKSENARRTAWVYVDLNTDDVGGYVRRAQQVVEQEVQLPPGVTLVWSGQFTSMQRAAERLQLIVPMTLGLVFVLLYAHFRRFSSSLFVLAPTLLFAPIGGVWLMWALGFNVSVATTVGFIALLGLATEIGVVLISVLESALQRRAEAGQLRSMADVRAAIEEGAMQRVRPLVMTVLTTWVGLLPVMLGTGVGSRVMRRLAAPMVGGLVSATLLALVIMPVLVLWSKQVLLRSEPDGGAL